VTRAVQKSNKKSQNDSFLLRGVKKEKCSSSTQLDTVYFVRTPTRLISILVSTIEQPWRQVTRMKTLVTRMKTQVRRNNAWSCLVNSPERQELTKERSQLVVALAELEADKQLQKEASKEKKEKAKRDKAVKVRLLEADAINQSAPFLLFKRWRITALKFAQEARFSSTSQALLQGQSDSSH
jgi:hypothetical protein